ncbi:MAG: FG-GAP-like repeat-containing protein [Cyanobacteria bacterium P01_F01_bin.150]
MPSNAVLPQSSTTQFLNALTQPPGIANSVGVALGDVNGDGHFDAVVANYNGQANQLLLNDGYGRFTEAPNALPGLASSNDVSLGDLDGDGDLDAFIANNGVANQILFNDGSGSFAIAPLQPPGSHYSYAVSLGDVDNDGDLDAVVANYWGQSNQLLLNNGQGGFTESAIALPGQHYSNDIALGDLDQDGDLDAFVANYSKQANQVLLNDGTGIFTEAPDQPIGNGSSAGVSLGDVDGDGDLDAFVANYAGQANQLLLNDGTGRFTDAVVQPPDTGRSKGANLADLDGDGDLDAVVAHYGKPTQVLLNDGSGVFTEAENQPTQTGNSYGAELGDLDNDGDLDAFIANFRQANQVLLNNGTNYDLSGEGVFTVADQGTLTIDYLFDGGGFNKGQVGIFSLSGMEDLNPKSDEFLQEAARRATSNSDLGHVVISDQQHAARFRGAIAWERTTNRGAHIGQQTFEMQGGDRFAIILSQNIRLDRLAEEPTFASQVGQQAIFSIPEANPQQQNAKHMAHQIVDLNGLGAVGHGIYGMEDLQLTQGRADRDYNDVVFQIQGATSTVRPAAGTIHGRRDWRPTALGQSIINSAIQTVDQTVPGTTAHDTLLGSAGNDRIEGFKGRDILVGQQGNDILTGGNGEDTFVLGLEQGTDLITDFKANYDVIGLANGLTFGDLYLADQQIIHRDSAATLATIPGIDVATLTASNFVMM